MVLLRPHAFARPTGPCYTLPMTDRSEDAPESPIQRALRLKTEALKARPRAAGPRRESLANVAAGASKPWMKK